jgi:hypothetical protein
VAGRRSGDLPRNRWIGLTLAGTLGVLSALAWQGFVRPEPGSIPATVRQVVVPAETMKRARALRDEAEALTPTEVLLDEHARERWLPLAAELERTLERERPVEPLRSELEATLAALQRAGVRP